MLYNIESRNDLSNGACFVIRFPEEDLDKKALYTIEADWPNFVVPFRHRNVDGQIECVYQLGNRSKLRYRFGRRNADDYIEFWESLLKPILICGDWFMKPSSFVLETENIYVGRDEKTVSYIYVPSLQDCAGHDALSKLAQDVAEKNPVSDLDLENRVLRAIMQGFRPGEFLTMLKGSKFVKPVEKIFEVEEPVPVPPKPKDVPAEPDRPKNNPWRRNNEQSTGLEAVDPSPKNGTDKTGRGDDIHIDLDGANRKRGGKEAHKSRQKTEGEKHKKEPKHGGLFGGKKDKTGIIGGAADPSGPIEAYKAYPAPLPSVVKGGSEGNGGGETTILDDTVRLRLISGSPLPKVIEVNIEQGKAFTIGRFDVSVGVKQSSFEFDKNTMAVSRHHAAIERDQDGVYTIVDLNSKAGTFVDGTKITPNIPYKLTRGCRVSFGTNGADYMWEE